MYVENVIVIFILRLFKVKIKNKNISNSGEYKNHLI